MVFSEVVFCFLFLPLLLILYYIPGLKMFYKNLILLIASLLFYAWGEPRYVLLLILSVVFNYFMGLSLEVQSTNDAKRRKFLLGLAVFVNLLMLVIFKYLTFIMGNINEILHTNINFHVKLPIGISFYTFQAISYLVDVYRGQKAQRNVMNVGLYLALFPQLVAGPIVRYKTIEYEINYRKENFEEFSKGVCRFIIGLCKKIILADSVAIIANICFEDAKSLSVPMAWLGAIAFTFQIYYDFSGYSDMAIGLGNMFGFHFPENFNYPYCAHSVRDFWRRWHLSLSSWFRDYVYIPLGGSKCNKKRLLWNLFIVWSLTGIWHGANWTFVVWGGGYVLCLFL